jgi:hypothetical protein
VIKENNRRLKKNVFGPVEAARAERLSAKLLALAAEPKPQRDVEMNEGTSKHELLQSLILTCPCRTGRGGQGGRCEGGQ